MLESNRTRTLRERLRTGRPAFPPVGYGATNRATTLLSRGGMFGLQGCTHGFSARAPICRRKDGSCSQVRARGPVSASPWPRSAPARRNAELVRIAIGKSVNLDYPSIDRNQFARIFGFGLAFKMTLSTIDDARARSATWTDAGRSASGRVGLRSIGLSAIVMRTDSHAAIPSLAICTWPRSDKFSGQPAGGHT